MVVEHGGEQVVGRADGVEVAREVQVDVLHGNDLRVTAAGGTALHAEHGAERGLSQGHGALDAATAQGIGQADGRGGLALARGRGVDGGHEHELGLVVGRLVQQRIVDLCLVEAVRDEVLRIHPSGLGDLLDGPRFNGMGNLDVGQHGKVPSARGITCSA